MKVRSHTWGEANLSWSVVMQELLYAMKQNGHTAHFLSTNGTAGMIHWDEMKHLADVESERLMRSSKEPYDIDITFTAPPNFPDRFLKTSKVKMALYDYESSIMNPNWRRYYQEVDFVVPSSKYVAEMFERNGCPSEKIKIVHHGVDLNIFHAGIQPMELPTQKTFKFLCVAEPHYRKQIDKLLEVYCSNFSSKDDVTLILKTKIFKDGDQLKPFEMDLRPILNKLKNKYGPFMPEIKIISKRIDNIASLYTACNAFVLMTASEGWGIPYLEALACGIPVIAPRHGGQLDFLNDSNSLLSDAGTRLARPQEQYWTVTLGATVGDPDPIHYGKLMKKMVEEYSDIRQKLTQPMSDTVLKFTWKSAAEKIIDIAKSTGRIG